MIFLAFILGIAGGYVLACADVTIRLHRAGHTMDEFLRWLGRDE